MAEAVKKTTRKLMQISSDQWIALNAACQNIARSVDMQIPDHLNSLTDLIAAMESLSEVIGSSRQREYKVQDTAARLHEELEQVERMKIRFIRNVSHELRTPLASIEGFAHALVRMDSMDPLAQDGHDHAAGHSPEGRGDAFSLGTRKHFLSIISQESQRLGKLIEDVLDLSAIEHNQKLRTATLFSANDIFMPAVLAFQDAHKPSRIRICVTPEPEGPMLYADQEAIAEILRQLIGNALKFSTDQQVILGAEQVSISPARESLVEGSERVGRVNSATRIYVKDQGIGIPKDELDCIFQKFYRVERSGDSFPGTGLGLSIVRELVNQNNGQVWAESEVGCGSTFYVMIPNNPPGVR